MAIPINPLPDLSQYNYDIGDTVDVVTKQSAINAEIEAMGQRINATVASINTDVQAVEDAEQNLDAAQIVHAPGSGLPNEAGTAYSSDVTTSDTDTTSGRLLKVGDFGAGGSLSIQPTLLGDVTTPGDYWIATNSPADKPTARFCHLYVRSYGGSSVHQIVQSRDTVGENFHRISDDSGVTWTAWERIHTTANQIELGKTPGSARAAIDAIAPGEYGLGSRVAPEVSDLNAFFSSGYYGVSSPATNKPVLGGGNLYVHSRVEEDFVSQMFHPLNENTLWIRNHVGYLGGWQPWQLMYNQQNIIGNVSQSGGIPTGAVIERGSNANGHYTKFADGGLICVQKNTNFGSPKASGSGVLGNLFNTAPYSWAYPHAFVSNGPDYLDGRLNDASLSVKNSIERTGLLTAYKADSSTVAYSLRFATISDATNTDDVYIDLFAIGRWY